MFFNKICLWYNNFHLFRTSKLKSRMHRYNSIGKVFKTTLFHSNLLHHFKQLLLSQKLLNWFNKVLITLCVICDHFTHFWNHVERILSVNFSKNRVLDLTEFQAHESSSWFEHSKRLFKSLTGTRDIPQTKRNSICIKGIVLKGQLLSISTYKLNFLHG